MYAESRADCETARARFAAEYQPKYSKAVDSLTTNWERLVTFFDFPAEQIILLQQQLASESVCLGFVVEFFLLMRGGERFGDSN
jgi:putative transposase